MSGDRGREYWEARYASAAGHGGPSPSLVALAEGLAPGTALDAGCGEGADARWLATRGWRVTAVDLSAAALRRAGEYAESLAAAAADRIDWLQADLATWVPPEGRFDLVSAQYLHAPAASHEGLLLRLAAAVAPGGRLLVAGRDPSDAHDAGGDPAAAPDQCLTATHRAALLDPEHWDLELAEVRTRTHTGHASHDGHDGRGLTLAEAVLQARRRDPRSAGNPRDA